MQFAFQAVPEPASVALTALGCLALFRRRKGRARAVAPVDRIRD